MESKPDGKADGESINIYLFRSLFCSDSHSPSRIVETRRTPEDICHSLEQQHM